MNRKKILTRSTMVVAVVALIIGLYMVFLNGNGLYFTFGMKKESLAYLNGDMTYTFEGQMLLSDAKKQYETLFGEGIWSSQIDGISYEEYIKDQVKSKLMRIRCMVQYAKDKGIVLGRDDNAKISSAVHDVMNALSDEKQATLGITESKLTEMFSDFALADKMYKQVVDNYKIEISSDEARVISIQYIVCDAEAQIEKAKQSLSQGQSFYVVANEFSLEQECDISLKRHEMVEEFDKVAFNLTTGQTSDTFKIGDKYYLLRCTSDNDRTKTENNRYTMLAKKQLEKFNEEFNGYETTVYIEWNSSVWDKLKISNMETIDCSFEEIFNSYFK